MKMGDGRRRYLCHDTSAAQLVWGRCCHPQGLDRLSPYCIWYYSTAQCMQNNTDAVHTNMGKQLCTQRTERWIGGGDTGKASKRRHSTKKYAAACVNWLLLPPLCQINSTGQGRGGGRERVWVGGWVLSFHQRAFLSPFSFCVWGSANSRVGNSFGDCMSRIKATSSTLEITPDSINKLCPKSWTMLCINHTLLHIHNFA